MEWIAISTTAWLRAAGILLGAVVAALVAHRLLLGIAHRLAGSEMNVSIVRQARRPARVLLLLLAIYLVLPLLPLAPNADDVIRHLVLLGLIAGGGWGAISTLLVIERLVSARYRTDVRDNLMARQIQTRFRVLRRVGVTTIVVLTVAFMLLTFPSIRNVGLGLLGSAGLAGLVLGIAARPLLSNLIAGVQVALTQPIRLDDVVIVEGEWGRIEEILTTFVVVRIWDERRLVVPLTYFIDHPFENWTRSTADLLGTVFLHCDYRVPVDEVRGQLHGILEKTELWDGRAWALQVTDADDRSIRLRALMSASDASTAWELRCHVREKLVAWLQREHPGSLPRLRADVLEGDGHDRDVRPAPS